LRRHRRDPLGHGGFVCTGVRADTIRAHRWALPRPARAEPLDIVEINGFPKALGLWRVQGRALALAYAANLNGLAVAANRTTIG